MQTLERNNKNAKGRNYIVRFIKINKVWWWGWFIWKNV